MALFNPTTVFTRNTPEARFWLAQDVRSTEWVAEVYVRRPDSVLYFVWRYRTRRRPTWNRLYRDACRHGRPSPRPYLLAQPCDGSITTCVIALFFDFCKARHLDPISLLTQAYPEEPVYAQQDVLSIRERADWEGTAFPRQWNSEALNGLLESLHAVNYHSLAGVITESIADTAAQRSLLQNSTT